MAASNRKALEKKAVSIEEKLPYNTKRLILSFLGKIGTMDFKYCNREFKDKTGQTQYPSFYGNLLVLCSYIERATLTEEIAINLLHLIKVEQTLIRAQQNPKSLPIPVLVQDPYGQWIEAKPVQAVYAAGDRNPPNMPPGSKNFGLVERLSECYQNPAHAEKHVAEWKKNDFEKATQETMAPYLAAMAGVFNEVIECKEISDDVRWEDVLTLDEFSKIAKNFDRGLIPNPNHIVRSGFLFSMQIVPDLFNMFKANVDNSAVEDKERPNLGGWWSRKSDAADAIIYPRIQARSQRCDQGNFKKGIGNVAEGQIPDRLDFTNGPPASLSGIVDTKTHFFGFFGTKYARGGGRGCRYAMVRGDGAFRNLCQAKTAPLGITRRTQLSHPPSRCVTM